MHGKEDERQVVTTYDIQKTLRTQLNYNLLPLGIGFICSWFFVSFSIRLTAEMFSMQRDAFFIMAVLYTISIIAITFLL